MKRQFMVEIESSESKVSEDDAMREMIWMLVSRWMCGGGDYHNPGSQSVQQTYITGVTVKEVK